MQVVLGCYSSFSFIIFSASQKGRGVFGLRSYPGFLNFPPTFRGFFVGCFGGLRVSPVDTYPKLRSFFLMYCSQFCFLGSVWASNKAQWTTTAQLTRNVVSCYMCVVGKPVVKNSRYTVTRHLLYESILIHCIKTVFYQKLFSPFSKYEKIHR